jgi:hypothetical protein
MKRYFALLLLCLAFGGFMAAGAFGRGGHGGGGHHGGHHAGHHSHSHHHAHHHAHHAHHVHHHVGHHGAFSHGWHHNHPGAWGWGAGGYAWGNPWAAATLGTAAGWLGLSALDAGTGPAAETIVNNDNTPIAGGPLADEPDDADDDTDNIQVAGNDPNDGLAQPDDAPALAARGTAEPEADARFLPLGVFSVAPADQTDAVALVHLAISKDGLVRGTYYDLKTDKDENIQGAVNKENHSVAWTIGNDRQTVYQTWLEDLTQEQSGPLTVRAEGGQTRVWTIARYTQQDDARPGNDAAAPNTQS